MDEPPPDDPAPTAEQYTAPLGCCAALALVCLLLLIVPPFMLITGHVSRVEVARAAAPGGRVHAVLVEVNGGATTDFAYSVRIESAGWLGFEQEVAWLYGAHRSGCAYGVNLRWAAADRLIVEYRDADQVRTTPARLGDCCIRVELRPGVTDDRAPCGGMEYNLRRRQAPAASPGPR